MNLNEWAKEIHQNAVDHGWWEDERSLPEILMLCVSELSEALEEYRDSRSAVRYPCKVAYTTMCEHGCDNIESAGCVGYEQANKPEGIAVEMADCIIRVLDYAGRKGWDMDEIVRQKHEYNKTRPYRHGGKKA